MTRRSILTACLTLATVPTIAAAQQFTRPDKIASVPKPVAMDTTGRFRAAVSRVGDDMFIAGQPTELGLREMHDRGVTTVVNLRTPEEMKAIGFDEAALVAQLGMKYVYLPVRGTAEAINFMGHMSSGPLPIEGFLGRELPSLHRGGN